MKAGNFFYKIGKVETTVPWLPPDPLFLNAWRDEFFKTPGIEHYTFWLCGSVMESWSTNDIDILITGEITTYQELENIIASGMQLGFKHRQLIDMAWNDYYKKYLIKGCCERRSICCDYFYHHDHCTIEQCTAIAPNVESIIIGNEVIKNGRILTPHDPEAIQLNDSLWKITFPSPSVKQIGYLRSGRVYTHPPIIITPDLDFRDYVNWP